MPKIIIASGPVIVEHDKVLLNKHGDTNFWKFCGGRAEDMEHTLIEIAQREVNEEMGLEVETLNQKPFLMHTIKEMPETGERVDVLLVHYLARRLNEVKPGAEIREWAWLALADLNELAKQGELAANIIPALRHFGFLT